MFERRVIAGGLFGMGLAALTAVFVIGEGGPAQAQEDSPGPNLVIEIAGEANGTVVIDLRPDVAPKHVEQITALAAEGQYDGVVFHRVIDGFMAQTGDVQFGKSGGDLSRAGMGGSSRSDIPAEFSDINFARGVVGMARAQNPNSANSQFFITFGDASWLNGQYTVWGKVVEGMEHVDQIKKGHPETGAMAKPDVMISVTVSDQ